MKESVGKILEVFSHIAREIQIYFLPGFIILSNICLINYFFFEGSLIDFIITRNLELYLIIFSYIFGQVSFAFYYCIIEIPKIDCLITQIFFNETKDFTHLLPKLREKNNDQYTFFIERYIILINMRWNLSASFTINAIINSISYIYFFSHKSLLLLATFDLAVGLMFYLLTKKTEVDYTHRIKSIIE